MFYQCCILCFSALNCVLHIRRFINKLLVLLITILLLVVKYGRRANVRNGMGGVLPHIPKMHAHASTFTPKQTHVVDTQSYERAHSQSPDSRASGSLVYNDCDVRESAHAVTC